MRKVVFGVVSGLMALAGVVAQADSCGGPYRVKPGENLSMIADRLYGDPTLWERLHAENMDVIGASPDAMRAGMVLTVPCMDGRPNALTEPKVSDAQAAAKGGLKVLTASGFAPFADRDLPDGGLIAAVVDAALTQAAPQTGHTIHWIEDREAHLDPLLSNALMDMGFPWPDPPCEQGLQRPECQSLLYSDPIFEMLSLLFVAADRGKAITSLDDMQGKRLCRPAGFPTHDLDRNGRQWVVDDQVTLLQPDQAADCVQLVLDGRADAMALDEFSGRVALRQAGAEGKIVALSDMPVAIETLHVVVPKTHPQAGQILDTFNKGLLKIRENGTFHDILSTHLTPFWEGS